MKFRKLRIAWSGACGAVCLLLIALWARSYWRAEVVTGRHIAHYEAISVRGRLKLSLLDDPWPVPLVSNHKSFGPDQRESDILYEHVQLYANGRGFRWDKHVRVLLPYWFPVVLLAICAGLPWLPSRFSLRTVLIATTLVAVVMGLVAYAARQ
jgi:hypothetical protein